MRAPTHLGGRDALLVEALDRPRVDELVLALRLVADLRVALGDVDRSSRRAPARAGSRRRPCARPRLRRAAASPTAPSSRQASAMSASAAFVKCETRPGLAPCSTHRRRPVVVAPARDPVAELHVPRVERALRRRARAQARVRVPHLQRRVHEAYVVSAAPFEEVGGARCSSPGRRSGRPARRGGRASRRRSRARSAPARSERPGRSPNARTPRRCRSRALCIATAAPARARRAAATCSETPHRVRSPESARRTPSPATPCSISASSTSSAKLV